MIPAFTPASKSASKTAESSCPVVGLVAGDPSGVGPELLAEVLRTPPEGVLLRVIGDPSPRVPGRPDHEGSVRAIASLEESASLALSGEIAAVVTGLASFLRRRGIHRPRIAVAGLNPHAGEQGDLGDEEERIIEPALPLLSTAEPGAAFSGPFSPDTVFWRAAQGEFDAVLCMYHDQGLIPLKLLGFHDGVNVTLGLPFVRTSPDHGTAYELAGTGKASPESFLSAVRLAAELVRKKDGNIGNPGKS